MTDQAESVAREWFEGVWHQRDSSVIHRLMHPSCEIHTEKGSLVGSLAWHRQMFHTFLAAFPDASVSVTGVVAARNEAVVRWRVHATHLGEWFGISGTGIRVSFSGMSWFDVRDGKIVATEDRWNRHALRDCLHTGLANASVNVFGVEEQPQVRSLAS